MKKYDAIIIGFGKGGKTLAAYLAKQNKKVAMIEKDENMYGGTCINVGCIPSKSLVHSGLIPNELNKVNKEEYYTNSIEKKEKLVKALRKKNFDNLDVLDHVDVILGEASFNDEHSVQLKTNNETFLLEADKIYLNTGGKAIIPKIEGIKDNPYVYYSNTLMARKEFIKELVIIGGGYIGLEFASMYANFQTKVHVIQDSDVFIAREDRDVANTILEILKEKGVTFHFQTKTTKIENNKLYINENGIDKTMSADAILIATGRKANTETLALDKAKVEVDQRGNVVVNEYLQTSNPNIYAMGDVKGGLQFTYISLDDFRIIRSNLEQENRTTLNRGEIPYSVFIDPAYSRIGLNEKEAIAQGYKIKVVKLESMKIPKAKVLENSKGVLKAIINLEDNMILGAMFVCAESYEMINLIKMAMDNHIPYTYLKNQIFTHPTMSESLNDLFSI